MSNPFRYFSSPEVIHLAVMMYVREPRDSPVLVEPGWSNVCRRDPQETRRDACGFISGVGIREGQRQIPLSLAGRRP
jgi:hypothetical protein